MKKLLFSLFAYVIILATLNIIALAYINVGLNNFIKYNKYENTFKDVQKNDWYYDNVTSSYEYSLMKGKDEKTFDPKGNITIAETITVAVRINSIYFYEMPPLFEMVEGVWYEPYVSYASESEIITEEYTNYNKAATRAEFAKILARSISDTDFEEINYIANGAIPDVDMNNDYAPAVYLLYRAGVLTGSDSKGTFKPNDTITRAEASAIITRIVDPSLRKNIELAGEF